MLGNIMNTDDKFGIAAGLMALGLAAGIILLGQLTFNKDYEEKASKYATQLADSKDAPGGKAAMPEPPPQPFPLYSLIPHREKVVPEAIFDGIVLLLALPGGIIMFVLGLLDSGNEAPSSESKSDQPQSA